MPAQTNLTADSPESKINIVPSIFSAFLSNIFKAIILLSALAFIFFMLKYITGTNPFLDIFDLFGLSAVWAFRVALVFVVILSMFVFFNTLSLSSYGAVFENGNLIYSYGHFFKITKNTPLTNVVSVNFKEYKPFKIGTLSIDLSGTDNKSMTIPYVSKVAEKCAAINGIVKLEKMKVNNIERQEYD